VSALLQCLTHQESDFNDLTLKAFIVPHRIIRSWYTGR